MEAILVLFDAEFFLFIYWKAQVEMERYFRIYIKSVILVCITILISSGCTGNSPIPTPTEPPTKIYEADLTVVQSTAKVIRNGDTETDVQQAQTVKVWQDDRIELDKQSRSILDFPGVLQSELFRNASVLFSDVKQETGGSTDITLNLSKGHIFLRLNDTSIARVTVETPYSTIKTLEDGTEFDVCHNDALTCVWVKKGAAEVIGKSKKQILNAGEASYVKRDQAPSMAICAPVATFSAWEDRFRNSPDTPALGEVVSGLPQEPCSVPVTGPASDNGIQADLIVNQSTAKVFEGGTSETEVQQDQSINLHVNDRIELGDQSAGLLRFPNILEAELLRNAIVLLKDVTQESGGSTDVALHLNQGHMFIRLNDANASQLTVETSDATITTLEKGTEFDICKSEELTCVMVMKGVVETVGQGKKETLHEGEASYILKGQPPSPPICAPVQIFTDWQENFRKAADTRALGQVVAQLPQQACSAQDPEIPPDARILYQDDFTKSTSGWPNVTIDNYSVGYSAEGYYYIQILNPSSKYPVYIPNKTKYYDVNVDLRVLTKIAGNGDFRYGLSFRRSGDNYYAFTISPRTKKWYVLKSSANALVSLKEGTDDSIQGLEAADTLRVSAKGSNFTFWINGRLIYMINDPDYAGGEVGLFVQTLDSPNVRVDFDSITIWENKTPGIVPAPQVKELCFNNRDDDGDGLIDKADPDCARKSAPTSQPPTATTEPPTTYP
jgi:ferric-dicitrate binding protein FerR (iron transport regulator)